jgi:GcrA cell cycle regulator
MVRDQWDDDRLALLKTLWASGVTAAAIAERLGGISRSAVLGKIFRLRLDTTVTSALRRADVGSRNSETACPQTSPTAPSSIPSRRRRGNRADPPPDAGAAAKRRGRGLLELTNDCCRWIVEAAVKWAASIVFSHFH